METEEQYEAFDGGDGGWGVKAIRDGVTVDLTYTGGLAAGEARARLFAASGLMREALERVAEWFEMLDNKTDHIFSAEEEIYGIVSDALLLAAPAPAEATE
jgi:hypothetical protein